MKHYFIKYKKTILAGWLIALAGCVVALFWYNDWQYRLPTPVPAGYQAVATGTRTDLQTVVKKNDGKPMFLHFFNPSCPCSRFNFRHFKWLASTYGQQVNFAIVLMSSSKYTEKEVQERFGTDLPVYFDTTLAKSCGVYSTPQAVIIDQDNKLYYRGNYNSSRYCTDKKTEYARIALDSLLNNQNTHFDQQALTAYGCQLPTCTR